MAIQWKEGELDDLRREIARYNRKIYRLQKKGVNLSMGELPKRMGEKTIKQINSRRELSILKSSIERFTAKGSETLVRTKQGIVIPKFERDEINAANARINARRRAAAKEAKAAMARGDLPLMGRIQDNNSRVRRSISKVTPKDYAEYKRVAFNEGSFDYTRRRDIEYRENYYKMVDRLFTPRDAVKVKEAIKKVNLRTFVKKTINVEDISFSLGSPMTLGRDTLAKRFAEEFKHSFKKQFENVYFDDVPGMIQDSKQALADSYEEDESEY